MSFSNPQQPAPNFGMPGPSPQQGWQPMPPMQPPAPAQQDKGDTEGLALLAVAIIFHILLNLYWLHADNHLVHLDEAHHINRAVAFYEALFPTEKAGLFERGVAALAVESPYPPLTHLTGAAFIRMFGYSPDVVAFSGSLFLALFLIGVYLFARQGMMGRNAFLVAFVAGSMPIIFGGSRYFMPDLLLAALVVWALYALVKSDRFRKTGWVALFAFFTGLAFLTKQTAFVYLLLPVLCIIGWGMVSVLYPIKSQALPLRRTRAAHLLFNMILCACIVMGVGSWWYTRHVEYMYTWWSTQRGGETGILQPAIAARIEFAMPETLEGAESRIYLDPAISRLTDPATKPAGPAPDDSVVAEKEKPPPEPERPALEETPEDEEMDESDSMDALLAPLEIKKEAPPEIEKEGSLEVKEEALLEERTATPPAHETDNAPPTPHPDFLEPFRQEWDVYPLYFVNEAAFLPIVLFALFGLPALLLRRNRNIMAFFLFVWLAGAYVLLTGLFTLRSPQLLFAVTPPAAVLCVLALDAVPRYRLRRALWGVLLFFILLQYVNLTLFPLGPIKRLEIPTLSDRPAVEEQHNRGLTVYKDRVALGHYTLHPPQRGEVITETLLTEMAAYEESRQKPEGPVAWYQVVAETPAHLSMDFYTRHYQPAPRPADNEEEPARMARPFAAVKWESRSPKDTLPELAETEYVILKQNLDGDYISRLEEWTAFFLPHGFESIFNQRFAGYGMATPGYVHVMARKEAPSLGNTPDIFGLYDLLDRDGRHWLLTEEDRAEAERRYARSLREYTHIQPLNDNVNLLGFHVKNATENWYVLRFLIHVNEAVEDDVRLWVRSTVHMDDRENLLDAQQGRDGLVWDFSPQPATTTWNRNQALVLSRPVLAAPLRYKIEMGILEPGQTARPAEIVETDWVDFAEER